MAQYNIHAAKSHLSRLVNRAAEGEEIILARAGKPVARIVALSDPAEQRVPGLLRGKIVIGDNFDEPTDDEGGWVESELEPQ
jgi:prevent-host-death family protein